VGCCECGDQPSGSGATELVSQLVKQEMKEIAWRPGLSLCLSVCPSF
jgi:hypothetical protein